MNKSDLTSIKFNQIILKSSCNLRLQILYFFSYFTFIFSYILNMDRVHMYHNIMLILLHDLISIKKLMQITVNF